MRIGLLITARLKSTRLPQKLLMDLNGRTIIERVIDRAKEVQYLDEIVICTSTDPQDKALTDIAISNDVHYYLGSPEDVLKRLQDAAHFFDLDYIISITGENPLFSIYHTNILVDRIRREGGDFLYFDGLPIGCATSGINKFALDVVCKVKDVIATEIWGPLLKRPEIFNVQKLEINDFYKRPHLRITTDYIEDYQFINKIYDNFREKTVPPLLKALTILDQNPSYLEINKDKRQAELDELVLEKINNNFQNNLSDIKKIKDEIYKKSK
jgi:spore coat polysaccharide biosynthesis protein SpsF